MVIRGSRLYWGRTILSYPLGSHKCICILRKSTHSILLTFLVATLNSEVRISTDCCSNDLKLKLWVGYSHNLGRTMQCRAISCTKISFHKELSSR